MVLAFSDAVSPVQLRTRGTSLVVSLDQEHVELDEDLRRGLGYALCTDHQRGSVILGIGALLDLVVTQKHGTAVRYFHIIACRAVWAVGDVETDHLGPLGPRLDVMTVAHFGELRSFDAKQGESTDVDAVRAAAAFAR